MRDWKMGKILDLTHPITAGMTTWPGDPEVLRHEVATVAKDGYALGQTTIGDHTGTHIGVGAHLHADGITLDQLPIDLLFRPAVTIDLPGSESLTTEMIEHWEGATGRIAGGSFVVVRTGRSSLFADRMGYRGETQEGTLRFPGVSLAAARLLGEDRGVVAIGIDTLGIDPGEDTELLTNRYWLRGNRYHIENLANLQKLPARNYTVVVCPMSIAGASGAPARVFALLDDDVE